MQEDYSLMFHRLHLKLLRNVAFTTVACKFPNNDYKKHGLVPLELRFAIDSVPCELTRKNLYTYVSEEEAFLNRVQLVGPKKDVDKRICTIHPVIRVKGKQFMPPTLIYRNANRVEEDPFKMPPGLLKKKVIYAGEEKWEHEHYHPVLRDYVI